MPKARRKILVVTGTRADYGLVRPILVALLRRKEISASLVVTGMHLSSQYGHTIKEIRADKFRVNGIVPLNPAGGSPDSLALAVGQGIKGFAQVFRRTRPHLLLIVGDRPEVFAAATAATFMNLIIAHVHGGDRTRAGMDEAIRHAITKMAHIHFPATERSADRLRRMGEDPNYIFQTGSPAIDDIYDVSSDFPLALRQKMGEACFTWKGYVVFLYHPVSTAPALAGKQASEILKGLRQLDMPVIYLYPNNDPGGCHVITAIKKHSAERPDGHVFRTLVRSHYLTLLKNARVLVGNSSSGIIDAASFQLPVVNVGSRQNGRERSCNVVDAEPKAISVQMALSKVLTDPRWRRGLRHCRNVYGDGRAGERIARQLATVRLSPDLLQKQITY